MARKIRPRGIRTSDPEVPGFAGKSVRKRSSGFVRTVELFWPKNVVRRLHHRLVCSKLSVPVRIPLQLFLVQHVVDVVALVDVVDEETASCAEADVVAVVVVLADVDHLPQKKFFSSLQSLSSKPS